MAEQIHHTFSIDLNNIKEEVLKGVRERLREEGLLPKKPTELKDTIEMMLSDDYIERFKAEYYQLNIRIKKLANLLSKDDADRDWSPTCADSVLHTQLAYMRKYRDLLGERAEIEGIKLNGEFLWEYK